MAALGEWCGLIFLESKVEWPSPRKNILGLCLDVYLQKVGLKSGKANKIVSKIDDALQSSEVEIDSLQMLLGNLVWASFVCFRLRAYLSFLIDVLVYLTQKDRKRLKKKKMPKSLLSLLLEDLAFLRRVLDMDPVVHVRKFLRMYKPLKTILWADASGWEIDSKNPLQGQLGGLFIHPFRKISRFAFSFAFSSIISLVKDKYGHKLVLRKDIHFLELLAAVIILVVFIFRFRKLVKGRTIIIKSDNSAAVSWINSGRCKFYPWNNLLKLLWILETIFDCHIICDWVPSARQKADVLTRSAPIATGSVPLLVNGVSVFATSLPGGLSCLSHVWNALIGSMSFHLTDKFFEEVDSFNNYPPPVRPELILRLLRACDKHEDTLSSRGINYDRPKILAGIKEIVSAGRADSTWNAAIRRCAAVSAVKGLSSYLDDELSVDLVAAVIICAKAVVGQSSLSSAVSVLCQSCCSSFLDKEVLKICKKGVKAIQAYGARFRDPINILHLFLASIKARHPLDRKFGIERTDVELSYIGVSALRAILAALPDGARVGTCTTSHLGVIRPFTEEEHLKCLTISCVRFFLPSREKCLFSDYSYADQLVIAKEISTVPNSRIEITFHKTKNLPIAVKSFSHFHPYGCRDLCFNCCFSRYIRVLL